MWISVIAPARVQSESTPLLYQDRRSLHGRPAGRCRRNAADEDARLGIAVYRGIVTAERGQGSRDALQRRRDPAGGFDMASSCRP